MCCVTTERRMQVRTYARTEIAQLKEESNDAKLRAQESNDAKLRAMHSPSPTLPTGRQGAVVASLAPVSFY